MQSAPAPLPSIAPPFLQVPTYTYPFTYTTPTAKWKNPKFPAATAMPLPSCSEGMCPALKGQRCVDSQGATYGVLCNTRFGGTIITNDGKRHLERSKKEKRNYTGSLDSCLGFCDMYSAKMCKGADFKHGFCHYYAVISGTIDSPGEVALVRQS